MSANGFGELLDATYVIISNRASNGAAPLTLGTAGELFSSSFFSVAL